MNLRELRIGNIVFDTKLKQPDVVICIEADGERVYLQNQGYTPIEAVEGVMLTEDWLLRFGFEREGTGGYYIAVPRAYKNGKLEKGGDFFVLKSKGQLVAKIGGKDNRFKVILEYVHQLQNLFFALTGHELVLDAEKETA